MEGQQTEKGPQKVDRTEWLGKCHSRVKPSVVPPPPTPGLEAGPAEAGAQVQPQDPSLERKPHGRAWGTSLKPVDIEQGTGELLPPGGI